MTRPGAPHETPLRRTRGIPGAPANRASSSRCCPPEAARSWANTLRRAGTVLAACLVIVGAATANAQTSNNANLSSVSVFVGSSQQTVSPMFAAATTSYDVTVANSATQVSFTAATAHSGATLDYLDASDSTLTDAEMGVSGFQHDIGVGPNIVKLKVTAEDTTTTKTYTFNIVRLGPLTSCSAASMERQVWTGHIDGGDLSGGGPDLLRMGHLGLPRRKSR